MRQFVATKKDQKQIWAFTVDCEIKLTWSLNLNIDSGCCTTVHRRRYIYHSYNIHACLDHLCSSLYEKEKVEEVPFLICLSGEVAKKLEKSSGKKGYFGKKKMVESTTFTRFLNDFLLVCRLVIFENTGQIKGS